MIQECRDPFLSSETPKGDAWFSTISAALQSSKVGVLFITAENQDEKWLHFEGGAMYSSLEKRVTPVLVGMKKGDYEGPFTNLQLTEPDDESDMYLLFEELNIECASPLPPAQLKVAFDAWWSGFEDGVKEVLAAQPEPVEKRSRTVDEKVDELLLIVRDLGRSPKGPATPSIADWPVPDAADWPAPDATDDDKLKHRKMMSWFRANFSGINVVQDGRIVGEVVDVVTFLNEDGHGGKARRVKVRWKDETREESIEDPMWLTLSNMPF